MTFQQLRYLLEVYKTGSIAKAAANLYLTRPSVSLCIHTLETELGYPIFVRTSQGLKPTPQGEKALECAIRIFDNYRMMTDLEQSEQHRIHIGTVKYEPVQNAVCRLVEEYRDNPNISFSFTSKTLSSMILKLSLQEMDAALVSPFTRIAQSWQQQIESKNLQWKALKQIPVMLCIGPGHRLYHKPDLSVEDFNGDILIDTPSRAFSRIPWIQDYVKFDPIRSVSSEHFFNELLMQGLGFSIRRLPTSKHIECYGIRSIPLKDLTQTLLYVTNPMRAPAPETERFEALLEEELKRA